MLDTCLILTDADLHSHFWTLVIDLWPTNRVRVSPVSCIIIIIITWFIRCWQNAAKYNHQVGLIHIKVDKTIHSLQMK